MTATAISLHLHLRPNRHRLFQYPNFINFFSSSSSSDDPSSPPPPPPQPQPQSSYSSDFTDLKAILKQSPPPPQQQHHHRSFSPSSANASFSTGASLDEVRKNLSEFRRRTTAPPPNSAGQQPISFQELYQRNVPGKHDLNQPGNGKPGLPPINVSLKQTNSSLQDKGDGTRMSSSFDWLPSNENSGRFIKYPSNLGSKMGVEKSMPDSMNIGFLSTYNYKEMGEKLRTLRPEVKGKNWFSLTELNERLKKAREIEEKEAQSRSNMGTVGILKDIKHTLGSMDKGGDKAKKSNIHKFDVLGQLGGTPDFMLLPPQEQLVEKYFHPDNMSSSEKLKIELKKVRDEFKMSESDCGSARVVVAQLTTKIKHLSSVLHKKDKHSRKGLQGMVQQRKKLLKYLRRTDWDSYCFVLSKLGLRDNPDYKA